MNPCGLVSVTYRNLTPAQVVETAKTAGLSYIEWGGDIHVPAGDTKTALQVGALTKAAGLGISSYGSYYKLGENADPKTAFLPHLACACTLGAPVIRVWAGTKPSEGCPKDYATRAAKDAKIICGMAAQKCITVALEYHPNTLTDCAASALRFLSLADHKNLKLYWQPDFKKDQRVLLDELAQVISHVIYAHVFFWDADKKRLPLSDGIGVWQEFLKLLSNNADCLYLLEFVKDDNPGALPAEANALRQILEVQK